MVHVLFSPLTVCMNEFVLDYLYWDINYVVTILLPIRTPSYLTDFFKFTSTFLIKNFCLFLGISKVCLWIQYEKVVLHCLLMFLFTVQLSSDIKENSEKRPIDCYKVTLSEKTRVEKRIWKLNPDIQNNSADEYIIIEFKLHQIQSLRCTLIWCNTVSSPHLPACLADFRKADTEYKISFEN